MARLIAVELNDLKSLTWWKRVCQLIAVGHIPLAIFSGCSDPIVRNPAALLNSRVQKRIDIWAKHLPKFMFPGGQPKNVSCRLFPAQKGPGF